MTSGVDDHVAEMAPIARVVVLADPEDPRPESVRWASELARALRVPTVLLAPDIVSSAEKPRGDRDEEIGRTRDTVERWLADLGVDVDEIVVTTDDPADAFEEMVGSGDVAVIGSGPIVGVTSFALGAVHHGLARSLDCPLVVVPSNRSAGVDGPIVAGLDGGRAGAVSEAWARTIADALGRELVGARATSSTAEERTTAPTRSDDLVIHERPGDAADVIRGVADRVGASLVVVTVKRERSAGGLLVGAVADDLLHEPPAPLAIITHDYVEAS